LAADCRWVRTDAEAWSTVDHANGPLCVFVHGNRASQREAIEMGWGVYHYLAEQADRPFRFVVWSWPADRVRTRNLSDVRLKAQRSDAQSQYLASWLGRLHPESRVSLVGYSLGARIITGALHMMGGGRVAGREMRADKDTPRRAPLRAVLVAAAADNDWLLPNRRNGLALDLVDRVLVTRNRRDPVLRRYHFMYGLCGPRALGSTGPAGSARLGSDRDKIEVVTLDCCVGRNHDWIAYLQARPLRSRLGRYAFLEPPAEQPD
jgi:hypothetical protein